MLTEKLMVQLRA